MKKNFRVVTMGILFVGMTLLVGCKKEDKIERNLWASGGEWNIDRWFLEETNEYHSEIFEDDLYIENESNCGTFVFKKDGTGNFKVTVDEYVYTEKFTYKNTENKLILNFKEDEDTGDQYSYFGEGESIFLIDWKKNSLEMTSQTWDIISVTNTQSFSNKTHRRINLSKKK